MRYFVITRKHIAITVCAVCAVTGITVSVTKEKSEAVPAFGMKDIVGEVIPSGENGSFADGIRNWVKEKKDVKSTDIMNEFSPVFGKDKETPVPTAASPSETASPVPTETVQPVEEKKIDENIAELKNETIYVISPEEYSGRVFEFPKDGAVLIVHTHTTESYVPEDSVTPDNSRNIDESKNIVAVGEVIAQVLTERGIRVIHDKTVHDYPSYQGAYTRSMNTVKRNLEKYPEISAVLDIHRDAVIKPDGTRIKLVTNVDGEECAQIMVVCGTNGSGLTHDNWKDNLFFGMKLTEKTNELGTGIMRPVNLREERFNQHLTKNSLIIEVGTNGNTLTEAKNGAKIFARAVADVINESKK